MSDKFLNTCYMILCEHNVTGLESIHTLSFLLFCLKHEYIRKDTKYNVEEIKKKIAKIYGLSEFILTEDQLNCIDTIVSQYQTENNNITIDNIISYYLEHDNAMLSREYNKYIHNQKLTEWIVESANVNIDMNPVILDGNMKHNSFLDIIVKKNGVKTSYLNKLYGVQTNDMMKNLMIFNLYNITGEKYGDNITTSELLSNDINLPHKFYDIIFCDLPTGLHNIIHANCCNKIKKLKLRGTKSEPLLLQLFMMSLNKNGRAILIVPDSLLFSDSVQPIETRKYLLENFSVRKIVEIDESMYNVKNTKNSILYFDNTGSKCDTIEISRIMTKGDKVIEDKLTSITKNMIQSNDNYSFWYKHYIVKNKPKTNIEYMPVQSLFTILQNNKNIKNMKVLVLDKYYVSSDSVKVLNSSDNVTGALYVVDNNNNNFSLYLLQHIINTYPQHFTKGKMNCFDMNKLANYSFPITNSEMQSTITNYMNISNKIMEQNNSMIQQNILLKKYFMETIPNDKMIELDKVCKIIDNSPSQNMIGIVRNSIAAGTVYRYDGTTMSTNSHYIVSTDMNYSIDFIYHWLKYKEPELIEASRMTPQPSINKSKLLSLTIPCLDISNQTNIVGYCADFDNNIIKYTSANQSIKEKNIFSILNKLCPIL
jgi:hypothetical protein